MFSKGSEKIATALLDNKIIDSDNYDICRYGINQCITTLFNFVTTLIIGLIYGMVLEAIFFTIAYIPVRIYAGGYHAKTPVGCWLFSAVILVIVLLAIKKFTISLLVSVLLLIASGSLVCILSPVEDANKPLDEIEMRVYKKRTLIMIISEAIILIIFLILKWQRIALCAIMAWVILSIMLIMGKLKNYLRKNANGGRYGGV